jgi:hypothetical protein
MATPRKRIPRPRVDRTVPAWVTRLVEDGIEPHFYTPEHGQFVDWMFFDAHISGLPPSRSREAAPILARMVEVWVPDLLKGVMPEEGTPEFHLFQDWRRGGHATGLPPADSAESVAIVAGLEL